MELRTPERNPPCGRRPRARISAMTAGGTNLVLERFVAEVRRVVPTVAVWATVRSPWVTSAPDAATTT
jgi:hypothetical protein